MTDPTPQFENPFTKYADLSTIQHIIENFEGDGVHAALWAVKASTPAVTRDGELELGGKKVPFTRVDDIRKALYPFFLRFGIMAYIELVDSHDQMQTANEPWTQAQGVNPETGAVDSRGLIGDTGRPIRDGKIVQTRMWSSVTYRIRFVFIGDASETIVGPVKALAYDTNSDKSVGKATTAAIKRLLAETFDIVDEKEEDNDGVNHEDDNRPVTTDRRTAQDGGDRGAQARAGATPGAAQRPGRPSRSGPKATAPEAPKVETPAPAPRVKVEESAPEPTPTQHPSDEAIEKVDPETGAVPDDARAEERPVAEEKVVEPETPPAPPKAPMPDKLAAAKARVKAANGKLNLSSAEVDAIATEVTGIETRAEWIVNSVAVAKLADALEARLS